ncbi:3-deoxy-7-phosphoheptulonate synthase class II [Helicobacter brantae]|uniref:Phospho-2-dehydro-3-deoxyheptonate aldolase n=1 Tax=Helicobacter brantae TaxID=375927 RepID=A0A3D8J3E0_9HELI|nr:3-deoxy-7-phosphoheptulonate synthase class II [Helicobacter brantae]RDU72047.1 3-deoxy-7-phosphoheptulonate synthase class II [Helicobacter brantae]
MSWTPSTWRSLPIKQSPNYADRERLVEVERELRGYPPLIFAKEVELLKSKIAKVQEGRAFILQGGDCAESFDRLSGAGIRDFYKLFLQMSVIVGYARGMEILKIGRIAGQFAKPRSEEFEEVGGVRIPSFRGDMINGIALDEREHNPERMLKAYHQSSSTLNLLRAFSKGGMADLHLISRYNLDFVTHNPLGQKYQALAKDISQALAFVESCGVDIDKRNEFGEFFVSHEALVLNYEEAMCREDSLGGGIYDCSSHFLWIGERTIDSPAHIEFMRGIKNPKGIKVSPRMSAERLLGLLDTLNPSNQKGEIVLIARMGEEYIASSLPPLLRATKERNVVWVNDPMHGNTIKSNGVKTRYFESILSEIRQFFALCEECGVYAGGLHLEMTQEDVSECIGGSVTIEGLGKNYATQCDPRLNATQSLELAFLVGEGL